MSAEGATGRAPGGEPLNAAASMEVFMTSLESSLGKSLQPLENVSKQMGSSKFGKNAKSLGGVLKGMAGASIQAFAMEQLMKLIEPFIKLLDLFAIPIDILAVLLTVMVNEIFVQLLPYIIEWAEILLELMPLFKALGIILAVLFLPIIIGIKWMRIVLDLWKKIFEFLGKVFIPIWEKVKKFFVDLGLWLKGFFVRLWDTIKLGFNAIINWFIGIINTVIGWMNLIPGVNIGKIPKLQKGGITTGETLAILHPNEAVVPLDRAGDFGLGRDPALLEAIEEGNRQRAIMMKRQREADAWRL